jgi:Protein of unknown function (DUF1501)
MDIFDRRSFVKAGSLSLFGLLSWGDVLRLRAATQSKPQREMSVIHFWLAGGISQLDSFDPKPEADEKCRSRFKSIPTNVPGIHLCEHLPEMARRADQFVIIRSMTHKIASHPEAMSFVMTGHEPLATIQVPSIQAIVAKELRSGSELPAAVAIPGVAGSWDRAGFLGPRYDPFSAGNPNQDNYKVKDLDLPMGVDWSRMDHRRGLLKLVDEKFRRMDKMGISESMESYYQTALDLMRSERAKKTFAIEDEPDAVRDRYGRTSTGQGALLARRLVEAGVRFVTVSRGVGAWDHHGNIFPQLANEYLGELDHAFSALIDDLKDRGMLDTTLVVVTGEFGRTPEINAFQGRDHWPNVFSLVLAGGGISGGRVLGESDKNGMFVKDTPVQVPDLLATIYKKLGVDYQKEYVSNIGRPIKIGANGNPISFLLS